uniref:Uncharacterized protein n=1 Tax=Arundo donax TaxID=35708 RepID=A0A0A9CDE9_ARUDO
MATTSSSLASVRFSTSFSSRFSSSLLKSLSCPNSEETLTILPSSEACRRGSSASMTCFVPW